MKPVFITTLDKTVQVTLFEKLTIQIGYDEFADCDLLFISLFAYWKGDAIRLFEVRSFKFGVEAYLELE